MFWHLLLAHFLGDYPLQSDWMVANRSRIWVRVLHGLTHFGLMVLLTFPAVIRIWPYLLLLTVIHLSIDVGKGKLIPHLPSRNIELYIADQAIHYLVIGLVSAWIARTTPASHLPFSRLVVLVAIGLLLVTYIWMITERILLAGRPYLEELSARAWPRALIRGSLFVFILAGWNVLFPLTAGLAMAVHLPYPATRSGIRALLIDILVTLVVAGFVITANQ